MKSFDIIVIGAGHAGCEASLAAARMGMNTALITFSEEKIAEMSCNPSIGGLAKGHLVREIDALGGEMAKAIDETGIQFRTLNKRKGPAVQAPRAQADKACYSLYFRELLPATPNLTLVFSEATELVVKDSVVSGIKTADGTLFSARSVILTTGTFLNGLIHIGPEKQRAGRIGDPAAVSLSESLSELGIEMGRLKTGTPARIRKDSIDFSKTTMQPGDEPPLPFSFHTGGLNLSQVPCWLTYTTEETHSIIRDNLHLSPLYGGEIVGIGPRYCPSIEDKVKKFPDRERHQVFLEPEGLDTDLYYPNGISSSLPREVQKEFIRSIPSLENAEIVIPGYAIEYDFVYPRQLRPTYELKTVENLYLAGQINGTSGYEEAAAQGLMAGINASLKLRGSAPFILRRDEAYIGVLTDDLVTRDVDEPYRLFTSRSEYRLILRCDNADKRLAEYGHSLGLISDEFMSKTVKKYSEADNLKDYLKKEIIKESELSDEARDEFFGFRKPGGLPLITLLKRPEYDISTLLGRLRPEVLDRYEDSVLKSAEVEIKYEGYLRNQRKAADKLAVIEKKLIPSDFDYSGIPGLSREAQEKLSRFRPSTLGQASRISGITPSAITALNIALGKNDGK